MSRQPLGEISGNSNHKGGVKGRLELTPHWRSHIVGRAAGGQAPKAIFNNLNIPLSIIKNTIYQDNSRYKNKHN